MRKNLSELFPEIFGDNNVVVKNWKDCESKFETEKRNLASAKIMVREHIKNEILKTVDNEVLRQILLQPISESSDEVKIEVIGALIDGHINDNGAYGYKHARVAGQIHVVKIFPGVESIFENRFYIKQLNAEIWFTPRNNDTEQVILYVGEIKEAD